MIARHASVGSRLIAATAAIALIVGACGGDSSGGGATAESWCDFLSRSDEVDEILDSLAADPTEIENGLRQVESIAKQLVEEAPPEIADDAKVISDGALMMVDAFEDAEFDIADADLSFLSDVELVTDLDAAGVSLDGYSQEECGRPFGEEDSSSGGDVPNDESGDPEGSGNFDPANGTLRDQLIEQFESIGLTKEESSCIAANLDFSDPSVQSGDVAAMLDVFGECGIGLERLTELGTG